MRVIPKDIIDSVKATSEDETTPAARLLHNEHPKDYWRAAKGNRQATLTFTLAAPSNVVKTPAKTLVVGGGGGDSTALMEDTLLQFDTIMGGVGDEQLLMEDTLLQFDTMMGVGTAYTTMTVPAVMKKVGISLVNTNATSATVHVGDPNEIVLVDTTLLDTELLQVVPSVTYDLFSLGGSTALWCEFDAVDAPTSVSITLVAPAGETVQAACPVAGIIEEFDDPQQGLSQGLVTYSLTRELSNGAFWRKDRDTVRTFSGSIVPRRDPDFYSFMHGVARENGFRPMAWRVTDLSSYEWVVFARFAQMPDGQHSIPTHSPINFSLIEVL